MKDYLDKDPWKIIESQFIPENNKITESVMSIGNGYMGQRANFEEGFSGETMQGAYLAGIYYPDKTKVGWWKNGYPEYFAKVLNSVNWIGIDIYLNGEKVNIHAEDIIKMQRSLDMQTSILRREMAFKTKTGNSFTIQSERFISWTRKELGVISYKITSHDFKGKLTLVSYLNAEVYNMDSNYDENFWERRSEGLFNDNLYVQSFTKKTNFEVRATMFNAVKSGQLIESSDLIKPMFTGKKMTFDVSSESVVHIEKTAIVVSSFHNAVKELDTKAETLLSEATSLGYDHLKSEHSEAWMQKWKESDIAIEGDVSAQQGIRFNIFHLHQTYSGDDARLNIGPKGFTGEKYGGSTYWDTEAYCIPFYMSNSDKSVSRNLLMYRYKQLDKAIENAQKLGFKNGAALYPMVTMNGEECHNEWEITFEEIHRNGAIAYAIYDYTRYFNDNEYLISYGIDVLIGIARFWAQRVNWSKKKKAYVMLGVTGPNEYENNVNNNWYTNYIAQWCLEYTMESLKEIESIEKERYAQVLEKNKLESAELSHWFEVADKMYFPIDDELGIFLQQDGFMDKELDPVSEIPHSERPLNQNWSWDRILRSCYIKQADVLQGMYFFENDFKDDVIKKHFDFYEPLTVHESSLSPCVHSILAAKLGMEDKAYEMYLRTARLDLDDYNNDTEDGLHITSMAGTWMAIVKGFGGMRVKDNILVFNPFIPNNWESYSFKIKFRNSSINVEVDSSHVKLNNLSKDSVHLQVNGKEHLLDGLNELITPYKTLEYA